MGKVLCHFEGRLFDDEAFEQVPSIGLVHMVREPHTVDGDLLTPEELTPLPGALPLDRRAP